MGTQKIKISELRNLVKEIINEEKKKRKSINETINKSNIKKINLNEFKLLIKKIIKEEVEIEQGIESEIGTYNDMDVHKDDIALAKRLENYLKYLINHIKIYPLYRNKNKYKYLKPKDEYEGIKWLVFKITIPDPSTFIEISEIINKIKKFFSTKPNNYELLSNDDSDFKFKTNNDKLIIQFEVKNLYSSSNKKMKRKDVMDTSIGKKYREGGF